MDVVIELLVFAVLVVGLGVQFRGEQLRVLPTVQGLAAVRLFDKIRKAAPQATYLVSQHGATRPAE